MRGWEGPGPTWEPGCIRRWSGVHLGTGCACRGVGTLPRALGRGPPAAVCTELAGQKAALRLTVQVPDQTLTLPGCMSVTASHFPSQGFGFLSSKSKIPWPRARQTGHSPSKMGISRPSTDFPQCPQPLRTPEPCTATARYWVGAQQ